MAAPELSKYLVSRLYSTLGFQAPDNGHYVMGDASDASMYWDGSRVVLEGGILAASLGVEIPDGSALSWGNSLDASITWDGTRLAHTGAEQIFRRDITVPISGSTNSSLGNVGHQSGVFAPDRAMLIKSCRFAWTQVPQSTTAGDAWALRLVRKGRSGIASSNLFEVPGSVLMSGMTNYIVRDVTLTTNTTLLTLAAGDYIVASIDVNGISVLNTAGLGGAVTLEYEVYASG